MTFSGFDARPSPTPGVPGVGGTKMRNLMKRMLGHAPQPRDLSLKELQAKGRLPPFAADDQMIREWILKGR